MDDAKTAVESRRDYARPAYDAGAVGRVYRGISMVGIVMAVGGVLAELTMFGQMRSGLWPLREITGAMMAGEPSAWTTLGIWILLAGPVLALISMLISGIKRESWPAAILSAAVLAIIVVAVPIKTWVEGGL